MVRYSFFDDASFLYGTMGVLGAVTVHSTPNALGDVVVSQSINNQNTDGGYIVRILGSVTMGGTGGTISFQYAQFQPMSWPA